ncbi:hypothetical protein GCM10020256_48410 [Streptomyces thermocoprophilus]
MSAESAAEGRGVSPARERWNRFFQGLQKMGRSLQLPIAVLPAAGILNRLGQNDVFGDDGLGWTNVSKVMAAAGGALLDGSLGLPLLFCVGVAIGMAKKADGSTALAAVVGFLVYYVVLHQFPDDCPSGTFQELGGALGGVCTVPDGGAATAAAYQNPGVFGGIVIGLLTAFFSGSGITGRSWWTGWGSSTGGGWCRSSCRSWGSCSRWCVCGCGRRSAVVWRISRTGCGMPGRGARRCSV